MTELIAVLCPVTSCGHPWAKHLVENREYVYYGSHQTYTLVSVLCKSCVDEEGQPTECLSE